MVTVSELVEVKTLLSLLGEVPTATEVRGYLQDRLPEAWSDRWWKVPSSGLWRASESQDLRRARQPYVDLPGSPAST